MNRVCFALVASLISTPLLAQSDQAPPSSVDETIVVEGQRLDANAVVRETISGAGVMQLARFEDNVCPGVVGLAREQAERMLQLIRNNVVGFGGDVEKGGCTANATVIFTEQPVEFVKKMAAKQPAYFDLSPTGLQEFTARPRPVVSWHVEEFRDRDGQELGDSREVGMAKQRILNMPASAGVPMGAKMLRNSGASHLATNGRSDMLFGFVVLDSAKLSGKSLEQLAALATLHLLLDIKQNAGASNPASILSLFDDRPEGTSPPPGFTTLDRAMIEGLYRPKENNRTAAQQFAQIATAIRKAGSRE